MPFPNPDALPLVDTNIGRGIVIPTSDPDHGRKVMAIMGALAAGARKLPKRLTPAEQYERHLADFGEAFCRRIAGVNPHTYPSDVTDRLLYGAAASARAA